MAKAATATKIEPSAEIGAAPSIPDATDALTPEGFRYDKVVARVARMLPVDEIRTAGIAWNDWSCMAHADHTIQDVCHPRYLWNRHEQIKPGDTVTIKHPFGFYVIVLDVIKINAAARGIESYIRSITDYSSVPAERMIRPTLAAARIEHLGPERGWSVVDDRHVAKDGFQTREDAVKWLDEMRQV